MNISPLHPQKSWILHGRAIESDRAHIADRLARLLQLKSVRYDWDGQVESFATVDTLHVVDRLPTTVGGMRRVVRLSEAVLMIQRRRTE